MRGSDPDQPKYAGFVRLMVESLATQFKLDDPLPPDEGAGLLGFESEKAEPWQARPSHDRSRERFQRPEVLGNPQTALEGARK